MATLASRVSIYNMALGFIGTRMVASANERTPEAIQCSLYWDRARRSALRDFAYVFAQKRVSLAAKELPEEYASLWSQAYAMPHDCLRLLRVDDGSDSRGTYTVGNCDGELLILTNIPNALATYVTDVEDIQLWDELFVMSMAYRLAILIAVPLLKNNARKLQELSELYKAALSSAEGMSATEEKTETSASDEAQDSWLEARGVW